MLVALADAKGTVLSREDMLQTCWDGRIVGDDAINRAVAEARKILLATGADFEIETIPRVGYRLNGLDFRDGPGPNAEVQPQSIGRRRLVVGGIAAAAIIAGGSGALVFRKRQSEIDELIKRGSTVQASGLPEDHKRAETLFRQAIASNPERADAWGWLAVVSTEPNAARDAAQRAIAINRKEPNARAILATQRQDLDGWVKWEDTLLDVLKDTPGNAFALEQLTLFYQGMGRCKDSLQTNERAIAIEPFNPTHQARRALKHWIFGKLGNADKVADRGLELWPRNPTIWNARLMIYAFTNRASAALALLDDKSSLPHNLTVSSVESWRAALTAISSRTPSDIKHALHVCTRTATLAPGLAANAIMAFSYLGQLDAAYRVAAGLLEGKGQIVQQSRGKGIRDVYSGPVWGRTQFLFIPATAAFRGDSRFPELCQRLGHTDYWRQRGIWPDPFVRGAIDPSKFA